MRDKIVLSQVDAKMAVDTSFVEEVAVLLQKLVKAGAPIGWVEPPSIKEVAKLIQTLVKESETNDASLITISLNQTLVGIGYWKRYSRPTHAPHADIEKLAIDPQYQGHGLGRKLMKQLIATASEARIEMLTLDFRGDNIRAKKLYQSLGFTEYGRLPRFVAFGEKRYDAIFYAIDLRQA